MLLDMVGMCSVVHKIYSFSSFVSLLFESFIFQRPWPFVYIWLVLFVVSSYMFLYPLCFL